MSTKLICIDTKPLQIDAGYNLGLELGKEYELFGVHKCKLTKFDVGIPHPSLHHYTRIQCAECRQLFPNRNIHFYSWRFIKLDPGFKEQFESETRLNQLGINPSRHPLFTEEPTPYSSIGVKVK